MGGYTFSERTKAVISEADSQLYTKPSNQILQILDAQLIKPLSDTLWNKIKVLRVFSYNQNDVSAFSLLNLKSPTQNYATVNGGMTFSYGGWKGNGTDGWINQNYNPVSAANGYALNSAFQAFFVRRRSEGGNNALAGQVTSTATQIRNALSTNQRLNAGANLASALDLSGEGFKAINRPDASNVNGYADLVKSDRASNSFQLPNENMTLFRFGSTYGDMELSFYAAGESLTESEMNELRNRFNAYYTAIWEIGMSGVLNLYFLSGQSNSTGRGSNSLIAPDLDGLVGAKIFALKPGPFPGTINSSSEWEELELGVNNTTESPAIQHGIEMRFGKNMYDVNNNVGLVKFGIGATSMATVWSVGGSGNQTLKRISFNYALTDIHDVLRLRVVPRGFIWIQGESDCTGGNGALYGTRYKAMIKDFIDSANNVGMKLSKLRWFTFLTKNGGSAGYDPTDYANVRAGQIDAMDNFLTENPTYVNKIKALTYLSTDDIPLVDTQHYNTAGLDTMGTQAFDYFSQYLNE